MVDVLRSNWPGAGGSEIDDFEQRKIRSALILNALQCVAQPGFLEWIYPKRTADYYARRRKADLDWFLSDREKLPFRGYESLTYRRCCEDLGINHRDLRAVLRARGWLDGSCTFELRDAQTKRFLEALNDPSLLDYFRRRRSPRPPRKSPTSRERYLG